MKIRITLLSLLSLFIFSSKNLSAQKKKDKRVRINFVQLPEKKLANDHKTYSVAVAGYGMSQHNVNRTKMQENFALNGFKYVPSGGHLRVTLWAGNCRRSNAEFKSKENKTKDKEGNVKVTKSYWYDFTYNMATKYTVFDPEGKVLIEVPMNNSEKISSSSTSTAAAARNTYRQSEAAAAKKFRSNHINNLQRSALKHVRKSYDFTNTSRTPELYYFKKYDAGAESEKHIDDLKKVFKDAKSTDDPAVVWEKIKPAVEFWEAQTQIDVSKGKKLPMVVESCKYNLAIVNLYFGDMEKAKTLATELKEADPKSKKYKRLVKQMEGLEKVFALHGTTSMHYVRDLSDAKPPAVLSKLKEEEEKFEAENESVEGSVRIEGESIKGKIYHDKEDEKLLFGKDGNVVFREGDKEHDLMDAKITSFTIGERRFYKKEFTPMAGGAGDKGTYVMEELYGSDKIRLFKYYPSAAALEDQKTEFAFQKTGEDAPASLESTQFLILKKGLAKYFAKCPDLVEMCSEGAFKLNKDDLIKAARIYSEVCE